jgi:hypothetical protein
MFKPTQMLNYCRQQHSSNDFWVQKVGKRKTDDTMKGKRMNASVTNPIKPKHSLQNVGHNQQIGIFWTYNAQLRVCGKYFDIRTDRRKWKIRKTVHKMVSRNIRDRDDELVQHLN